MTERIRAENLSKRFGNQVALDSVTLSLYEGEVLGIFGLSGSGKTTLIRVLGGIIKPDHGAVTIHTRPSVWFAEPALDREFSAFDSLWLWATLFGIPRRKRYSVIREMLNLVDLDGVREHRVGTFSYGMLKRLEAARALLSPSGVILADEPMAGLDSRLRERLWEHIMLRRSVEKHAFIVATSRTEDAEMCDRIGILHEGRLLACGTLAQIRGASGNDVVAIKPLDTKRLSARARGSGIVAQEHEGTLIVQMGPDTRPSDIVRQLGDEISAVHIRTQSLDSVLEGLVREQSASKRDPGN